METQFVSTMNTWELIRTDLTGPLMRLSRDVEKRDLLSELSLRKQNNRKSNLRCDSIKEKLQISNRMVWTLRRCICIVHANSCLRNTQSTSDVQRSPTVLGFGKNSTQTHLRLSCFQQTHCTWSGVVAKAVGFHWSSATSINHLRILTRQ